MSTYNMRDRSRIVNRKMHDGTRNKGYANLQDGVVFPDPKPSDWRDDMTVCIAGVCDSDETIAVVVDRMISLPYITADSIGVKANMIGHKWFALHAADDATDVEPILDSVKVMHQVMGPLSYVQQIESAFTDAYQLERKTRAEKQVLGVYGLNMKRFMAEGLQSFGVQRFGELCREIEDIRLQCSFLIAGFDAVNDPQIVHIETSGHASRMTRFGFWAIGSGGYSALGMLFYHRYTRLLKFGEAVYHLCESKFMAESSPGVGQDTLVFSIKANGEFMALRSGEIDKIKKVWTRKGSPRIPRGIGDLVQKSNWLSFNLPPEPAQPSPPPSTIHLPTAVEPKDITGEDKTN